MNFIDIANLRWSNIDNNRLYYTRSKTKKDIFNIPLKENTLKILNFYKQFRTTENDYIFPILFERHNTASKKHNRIKKILKQMNSDIKKIAAQNDIKTNLSSYVARHTFATVLKKSNVSTAIISDLMRHESESQTSTYLDEFDNIILENATDNLI